MVDVRPRGPGALAFGFLVLGALLAPAPIHAEVVPTVTAEAFNSVFFTEDHSIATGVGRGELDLRSRGSSDVRGRLQIRTLLTEIDGESVTELTVPRAEIRWRTTVAESVRLRLTAGRSRLSWGDGVLFNAGDTINGVAPQSIDLTADTLRDETQWLVAGYLPLGRFAFVEPVVLVPGSAPAWHTAAGGRTQFQLADVKTELGYLYRGKEEVHQPSVSVQGHLLVDWYAAASLRLPDPPSKELFTSGGLLHNGTTPGGAPWSARTEVLWQQNGELFSVYPEFTWSPSSLFSLFLRSQVTPVENATLRHADEIESVSTVGFTWTPATGLELSLFFSGLTFRGTPGSGAGTTGESSSPTGTVSGATGATGGTAPAPTTPANRETTPAGSLTAAISYTF
ncbi:MAG: hypothetical protein PF508_02835 [Spirochaeta sp.]|nr:hypothetical protein [Spirochaeta sp.]